MRQLLFSILVCISVYTNAQVSVIGTSTPSNDWTTDHDMVETAPGSGIWTLTITLTANEIKFRENNSWTNNWGNTSFPSGIGILDSPNNIPIPQSGMYTITFNRTTLAYNFINSNSVNIIGLLNVSGNVNISGAIAQEAIIEPILLNGWQNDGGSNAPAQFYKDKEGRVHLSGLVKFGTSITMFTLPEGYRPSTSGAQIFSVLHLAGTSPTQTYLRINPNGDVQTEGLFFVSLSGVSFRAD